MAFHAALAVELVTGAVRGLAGAVVDRFGGGTASSPVATGGPGFPGAGPVALPGTLAGPVDPIQAGGGFGGIVPVIGQVAGTIIRRVAGPAAVIGGAELVFGGGGGGAVPTTRKQVILATARANNPGATSKKIIRSARQCGIELAAATFGLSVLDVCFLIAQPATRRSRGISAADLRCVSRTARKFDTLQHNLSHLKGTRRTYSKRK